MIPQVRKFSPLGAITAFLLLFPVSGSAQTATPPAAATNAGNQTLGVAGTPFAITFNIGTGGALGTTNVLTLGKSGFDFQQSSGSTCIGTVSASSSCSVYVTFTPQSSSLRMGAVQLTNSSGTVIATARIYGLGTGPVTHFTPGMINTVAGTGTGAYNGDGAAATTQLYRPNALVADGAGNIYISDQFNNRIRYYDATAKTITTIIGTGNTSPYNDGVAGTSANINPGGIALDGAGNLYVADYANNRIRRYDPVTKLLTTIVGTGNENYNGENVAALSANIGASYLALDVLGNVYFTEYSNNRVRVYTAATGNVTTVAGTGTAGYNGDGNPATNYQVNNPDGIAVGADGNLYFSDFSGGRVRKVTLPGGTISTVSDTSNTTKPNGIRFNGANDLYFANQGNDVISKITNSTQIQSVVAGNGNYSFSGDGGPATSAALNQANDVALDNVGNIYIPDQNNQRLRVVTLNTPTPLSFASTVVGSTSTQTETIENDGTSNLVFSSIKAIQTDTNNYFATGGTCSTSTPLTPGSSCTVIVTFAPLMSGAQTGTVTIVDNSSVPTHTFAVSGTATAASGSSSQTINFTQPVTPAAAGTMATLSATASSGLPISYSVVSGPAVMISSNMVSYTDVGSVVLQAANYGNSTYASATAQRTVTTTALSQTVGTTSSTLAATMTIGLAGTVGSIGGYTQGVLNEDYKVIPGGTCTIGTAYTVSQTCTVYYTFSPQHPWTRAGGIVLADTGGNEMSVNFVHYVANGGQMLVNSSAGVTPTYVVGGGLGLLANDNGVAVSFNQLSRDPVGNIYSISIANGLYGFSISQQPVTGGAALNTIPAYYRSSNQQAQIYSLANYLDGTLSFAFVGVDYSPGNGYSNVSGVQRVPVGTGNLIGSSPSGTVSYPYPSRASGLVFDASGNLYGDTSAYPTNTSNNTQIFVGSTYLPIAGRTFNAGLGGEGITMDPMGNLFFIEREVVLWEIPAAQLANYYTNGVIPTPTALQAMSNVGFKTLATDGWGNLFYTYKGSVYEYDYKDPPAFAYAFTAPGSTSAEQGLMLTNNGNQSISISSITFSNSAFQNAGDGTCSVGTVLQSSQASSCTFNIVLKPTSGAASITGTVTIVDSLNFSHVVNLSGSSAPVVTGISPNTGNVAGGTSVSITGAGLTGVSAVYFGATAASSFTLNGDTSITATSPTVVNKGAVDITVVRGGVTSATSSADQFTYVKSTKTISFSLPATANAGDQATLNATASNGDPVTYSVTGGTATISGNVVTFTTPGAVTVTASSAETATYNAASTAANVAVSAQALTTANLGANQVTLQLTSTTTGTGYFTLLPGASAACGTATQVKLGQSSTGTAAYRFGSLPLIASITGSYTVKNLTQNTAYTVCFTPDGTTAPSTANVTTQMTVSVNPGNWTGVGTGSFSTVQATFESLAFAPDGTPYVAYADGTSNKATVKRYDGTSWAVVGAADFSSAQAYYISLAFSPDGTPYVAYEDYVDTTANSTLNKATVMKYNGSSWVAVGAADFSAGTAVYESLAFGPDGTPYVAYQDSSNSLKATVMKYNGSSWVVVGTAGFSAARADSVSLAFGLDGAPNVAYEDWGNSLKTTVMRYNGTSWMAVGTTGLSTARADFESLAFGPDGTPYVAYRDYFFADPNSNNGKATVMRYSGGSWVVVGTAGFSAAGASNESLAFSPDGTPYLAYEDDANSVKATVMHYDGTSWAVAGTAGISSSNAYYESLAVGPDGTPWLAYFDINTNGSVQKLVGYVAAPTVTRIRPASGPMSGGTTVQITGTSFTSATAVNFGSTAATSFTINSPTWITAVSPAASASSTVDVTVSSMAGTSATGTADLFTYQQPAPIVVWNPSSYTGYASVPIGSGVLDATSTTPGSFAYTATPTGGVATSITGTSTLATGSYTLTANFTPTDTTTYPATSATISFVVVRQSIFVANSNGSVSSYLDSGTAQSNTVSGGGIGVAVDNNGDVWSIATGGNSVQKFSDAGVAATSYSSTGLSGATSLAIDGAGTVWFAQGGGSNDVYALTNAGTPVSSTGLATAGGVSTPTSITVDTAGSLWIANSNNTITEVIGVAAPVATPVVTQVIGATPGVRP